MENIEKQKKVKPTAKKPAQKKTAQTKAKVEKKETAKKEVLKKKVVGTKETGENKTEGKTYSKPEAESSQTRGQENKSEESDSTKFWDETKESVVEGAKVFSEEAKKWSKKISSYSETFFGKIKENTSEVFKYGLDLTNEGVHKAQEMAEHLKDNYEIRKLNAKKQEVASQLGVKIYLAIKNSNDEIPNALMKDDEIVSLLKELEEIDKSILKFSEELEKRN